MGHFPERELMGTRFRKVRGEDRLEWSSANPDTTQELRAKLDLVLGAGNYRCEQRLAESKRHMVDDVVIEGRDKLEKIVIAGGVFEASITYDSRLKNRQEGQSRA